MVDDTPPGPAVQPNGAQQDPPQRQPDQHAEILRRLLGAVIRLIAQNERHQAEHHEEDERRQAAHYQLNRRLDLIMGDFNDVFPDEVMARAYFDAVNPGREFPDDVKRRRKRRALASKGGKRRGKGKQLPNVEG